MKPLQVKVKIPQKQYVMFSYYQFYSKPFIIVAHAVILITLIANVVMYMQGNPQPNFARNTFLVISVTGILLPFSLYSQFVRKYKKNPLLIGELIYEFTQTKIKVKMLGKENTMGWEKLYKVKEYKSWFLLYTDNFTASYIPKNCFENKEQIDQLKTLINSKKDLKKSLQK
ncbi:MAG: hypothetical protein CMO01_14390 [Thalassobius sp.]|nr:hypothetical protein [Thalassovita sp.]